jgi:hypothetical protein
VKLCMSLCTNPQLRPVSSPRLFHTPNHIGPTQVALHVVHSSTRPIALSLLGSTMLCTASTSAKTKTRDNF